MSQETKFHRFNYLDSSNYFWHFFLIQKMLWKLYANAQFVHSMSLLSCSGLLLNKIGVAITCSVSFYSKTAGSSLNSNSSLVVQPGHCAYKYSISAVGTAASSSLPFFLVFITTKPKVGLLLTSEHFCKDLKFSAWTLLLELGESLILQHGIFPVSGWPESMVMGWVGSLSRLQAVLQPEMEIVGWGWYYCSSFMVCVNQQPGSSLQVIFQKHFQGAGGQMNQKRVLGKCSSLLLILYLLKQEEMVLCGTIRECVLLLGQVMLGGSR